MEARVPVDPIFAAFGVDATVTRPQHTAIDTIAVWIPDESHGASWGVRDQADLEIERTVPRRLLCFRTDELPSAPVGTLILAPEEQGGAVKRWRVDEIGQVESDLIRVVVKPLAEADYLASWGKT